MVIRQGDIYWVAVDGPSGSAPSLPHPHVVVQDTVLNRSRITTVVVCAVTTNRKRATLPGNVLLDVDEANLPQQSIVVVTQVATVEKAQLGAYIGTLTQARIDQIFAGMRFVQKLTEHHDHADGEHERS